ncbi:MAG: type II toxin-antitoxin system Phd/YefM family antitoxin [Gammaproteobacteria bacterium]|nr:type II toxin-antitoxin system Phd/YefM family antitoxin [Gammaproteobacteria bacterium]
MKLHPQLIEKEGRNEFVVLPFDEYQALTELVEDYEDLMDLRSAKNAEQGKKPISLQQVISDLDL